MSVFVSQEGGLTVPGYVLTAVIVFAILIFAASIGQKNNKISTKQLVFSAAAIALAFVTSEIKLFHMPMGGSVTLFSMLLIVLIGYWYGPKVGIMAAIAYGLLQMIIDPYIVSIPQLLVDYVFAFGALGISGFFEDRKHGLIKGYIAGVLGRYFFSILSGVIFFGQYAPEGTSPFVYSVLYNGGYLAAEAAITIILLCVPAVSQALAHIKTQARA